MSAQLPTVFLDKLAKVCGLFSSDFDGERSTAAQRADKMVRDAGLTWPEVIAPTGPGKRRRRIWQEPKDVRSSLAMCMAFSGCLSDWERRFVANVAGPGRLSKKQRKVLSCLVNKARRYAAMTKGGADG